MIYRLYIKELIDKIITLTLFISLFPVFIVCVIILFISNKGKIFFLQTRPGKNEKLFRIIKFKTMNDKSDSTGILLPDNERLTNIGKLVRKLSLDEIPQLINVIKGDMSLVGPRPLLPEYLDIYSEEQKKRHTVKPGITGLAQVNGRNTISWKEKLEYDIWYSENLNFLLDLKIIFKTLIKVLKREGINSESSITMVKFNGNN